MGRRRRRRRSGKETATDLPPDWQSASLVGGRWVKLTGQSRMIDSDREEGSGLGDIPTGRTTTTTTTTTTYYYF